VTLVGRELAQALLALADLPDRVGWAPRPHVDRHAPLAHRPRGQGSRRDRLGNPRPPLRSVPPLAPSPPPLVRPSCCTVCCSPPWAGSRRQTHPCTHAHPLTAATASPPQVSEVCGEAIRARAAEQLAPLVGRSGPSRPRHGPPPGFDPQGRQPRSAVPWHTGERLTSGACVRLHYCAPAATRSSASTRTHSPAHTCSLAHTRIEDRYIDHSCMRQHRPRLLAAAATRASGLCAACTRGSTMMQNLNGGRPPPVRRGPWRVVDGAVAAAARESDPIGARGPCGCAPRHARLGSEGPRRAVARPCRARAAVRVASRALRIARLGGLTRVCARGSSERL
jgi:hypothetical protein